MRKAASATKSHEAGIRFCTADQGPAPPAFGKTAAVDRLEREAEWRVTSLSGVAAFAATWSLPLEPSFTLPFTIQGWEQITRFQGSATWHGVSAHYFDVFQIHSSRGRLFTGSDDAGSTPVVVINQTMAAKYWPGGNPVGQRIIIGKGIRPEFEEPAREIIGVADDVREAGLDRDPEPKV